MSKSNVLSGQITYIKGHEKSEQQAKKAFSSFKKYNNWDVDLVKGLTAKTVVDTPEFKTRVISDSRLHNFRTEDMNRFRTKMACAINHIRFFEKVIASDEPMAFLEHDAICIDDWKDWDFEEYLCLNVEYVFRPPNKLSFVNKRFPDFFFQNDFFGGSGVKDFPQDYPLLYYRQNPWAGSMMAPGTGAYAMTPKGAKKMLHAIEQYGMDQSDFMINSHNVRFQYAFPSLTKFNKVNLNTSLGVKK